MVAKKRNVSMRKKAPARKKASVKRKGPTRKKTITVKSNPRTRTKPVYYIGYIKGNSRMYYAGEGRRFSKTPAGGALYRTKSSAEKIARVLANELNEPVRVYKENL